ncbi:MAG: MarR family transcriptional regulator, partial [Erysipelotrichaceae bacterium]|nr:MarR family transcriptional regulator [Erysipelotrichaceae bacterium]
SALSPILNELEKKGLIERILDEHDRRQIIIRLIINPDEFMQERKDKIVEMMSTLSQEESIQFLNLLKKINEKLDNTND